MMVDATLTSVGLKRLIQLTMDTEQHAEHFMLVSRRAIGAIKRFRNVVRGRDSFLRRRARRVVRGSR